MRHSLLFLAACLAVGSTGCNRHNLPEQVTGAGSTFVNPLMVRWTAEYKRVEGEDIAYRSLGSTGGILWMTEKKADFGCTDAPMTDAQLAKARKVGGDVVHVPLVLGAVVPVYNLQGTKGALRFSGALLADIYLGKVTRWNEPALVALNPDVGLPDAPITVVHRADGSGTTYIWTDYLSKVSATWQKKVGAGQDPEWPVGVKQNGNEGVAEAVKKTPGSIGYVELSYMHQYDLTAGLVQNHAQEYVRATLDSITAAGDELGEIPDDLRFSLTDPPGKAAYPICGATWAVLFVQQPSGRGAKVVDFLRWTLHDGQGFAREQLYAPLPAAFVQRAQKKLDLVATGN
jgi:phosphate ABC transporter phosphate-binding protein